MKPNDPRLLVVGICTSIFFFGWILFARCKPVEVPMIGQWDRTPTICISEEVNADEVSVALRWWEDLGYTIAIDAHCRPGNYDISLDVNPLLDTRDSYDDVGLTHGNTVVSVLDKTIEVAHIDVLPGADALTIAHEFGHALGFMHPLFCPTGHIMHPHNPGWDARGIPMR